MLHVTVLFFVFLGIGLVAVSCRPEDRQVAVSFYYWKTAYRADSMEHTYLNRLGAKRLYVRVMDVDNQGPGNAPIPVSPVVFSDPLPDSMLLVPVVFIVNNVLKDRTEEELDDLAERLYKFAEGKVEQAGRSGFDELQVDCDWTASTRDAYFYLLRKLRGLMPDGTSLSATLRLHQVRNMRSSGIPPADKVLLMCYNMGNLRRFDTRNSILDPDEMALYLKGYLGRYPLHVDVALPLFSWSVVFRGGQYAGISKRLDPELLSDTALFSRLAGTNRYQLVVPMPEYGLRSGDIIRREEVHVQDVLQAAQFLSRELPRHDFNLIYYHLDRNLLTAFPYESLQEIIDCF